MNNSQELAYPMIKKIKPDIVITDIKMPFMDGLELASIIKKELPDTKIIILSVGEKAGFCWCVVKMRRNFHSLFRV